MEIPNSLYLITHGSCIIHSMHKFVSHLARIHSWYSSTFLSHVSTVCTSSPSVLMPASFSEGIWKHEASDETNFMQWMQNYHSGSARQYIPLRKYSHQLLSSLTPKTPQRAENTQNSQHQLSSISHSTWSNEESEQWEMVKEEEATWKWAGRRDDSKDDTVVMKMLLPHQRAHCDR